MPKIRGLNMSKLERMKPLQGIALGNQGFFNRFYRVYVEGGLVVAATHSAQWMGI